MLSLWQGTIPSGRAERLVKEHLCNPNELWSNYLLATWAKDEEGDYPDSRKMGAQLDRSDRDLYKLYDFLGLRIYGYETALFFDIPENNNSRTYIILKKASDNSDNCLVPFLSRYRKKY